MTTLNFINFDGWSKRTPLPIPIPSVDAELTWNFQSTLHVLYSNPEYFSSSSFQGSCHFGEASTIAWLKIFTINFKLNVPSLGPRSKLYSGNFCHLGWTEETTHFFSKTGSTKIETQSTKLLPLQTFILFHSLLLPRVTKTEFLLTISIQYQEDEWWELRKLSWIREFLVDPIRDPPYKPTK